MKKLCLFLVLCLCLTPVPAAWAEDCFTLNVDTLDMDSLNSDDYVARNLSAQSQGIRVVKYISDSSELAARVRLTLTRMDTQTLVFDKDFGYQSGTFDSDVIYLPYADSAAAPYLVTLYVEDTVYAMPFMHLRARLTYNGGCTSGVRLGELSPALGGDWTMGTMLDLDAMRYGGGVDMDVCASNLYVIGRATAMLNGDQLSVSLGFYPDANVEVHSVSLYVATDCAAASAYGMGGMQGVDLGGSVNVGGASSALIYLALQVSYDPASTLPGFWYDAYSGDNQRQLALWQANLGGGATDSGEEWTDGTQDGAWDDGSVDDGWNEGWDDGTGDDGWDEGWDEGAGDEDWGDGSGDPGWSDPEEEQWDTTPDEGEALYTP